VLPRRAAGCPGIDEPELAAGGLVVSYETRDDQVNLTAGSHVTYSPAARQGMTMTDKDREIVRELVRLEHLLMGLPGGPRPRLAVEGQDRSTGPGIRLAEVIPFRVRGT
jgi:hypothetical protein